MQYSFAEYGQRILPSAAGRTTMCPTELMYDASFAPSIRLLPIETRAENLSTSDYRDQPAAWTVLPLNLDAGADMHEVFKQVSLTRHVPVEEAKRYGLYDEDDPDMPVTLNDAGMVEISLWRHAIINFPHPLLKQGLVILDTPGLNAIGTEPELTLNLIPNAHAVLFILAADTGVTKSDIEVWRNHIGAGAGRLVVLNKIDSMWDELRSEAEVNIEIERQQANVAHVLALEPRQVFPVSAQKALVGKITQDPALLERSRLQSLESALFNELIPAKKEIVRKQLGEELQALSTAQLAMINARSRGVVEQLHELKSLRGKNQSVIAHMMRRIDVEKKEFDASLFKLQATRAVFTRLSTELYTSMGMDIVRDDIELVRQEMQRSRFFTGVREAVRNYFERIRANLDAAERKTLEISEMMGVMYRRFSNEHGLTLALPMPFSLEHYREEIASIEAIYYKQFGTATLADHQPRGADGEVLRHHRLARARLLPRRQQRCRGVAEGHHGAAGGADPPAQGPVETPAGVDPAHPRCDRQPGNRKSMRLRAASRSWRRRRRGSMNWRGRSASPSMRNSWRWTPPLKT